MAVTLTRKELLAVDNMAIIMKAKQDGLKVYASDLRINYAEMDQMLTDLEDDWMDAAAEVMVKLMKGWASKIKTKADMEKETGMAADLQRLLLAFIRSIWDYGQSTADVELLEAGLMEFDETKTNDDAFAWYQLYTKELAKQTDKAAFHYMQPTILEHLDQGTVGTELAAALEDDFRKFGQVRTKIIARTESNKAFNWGRRYRFDQSKAIAGYRYSAILDERTTEICQTLHGHSWAITDPALDQHTPPNHFMCRSVIVPISKYVTWEFDPPPAGWENDLPKKERTVFDRFKASEFYPKAETVTEMKKPTMEKPKAQKKTEVQGEPTLLISEVQSEPHKVIAQLIGVVFNAAGLKVVDQKWKEWTEIVEPFYKEGPKVEFQNKMFAMAAAVYMENDEQKIKRVERIYPGLLLFMESLFKRGNV